MTTVDASCAEMRQITVRSMLHQIHVIVGSRSPVRTLPQCGRFHKEGVGTETWTAGHRSGHCHSVAGFTKRV